MSRGYYFMLTEKCAGLDFFLVYNIKIKNSIRPLQDLTEGHFNPTCLIMDQFSKMYSNIILTSSYVLFLR
jgi:hypothetical protein